MFRHIHEEVDARRTVLATAIALDLVVLGAFVTIKAMADPLIIVVSTTAIAAIAAFEYVYLRKQRDGDPEDTEPTPREH